MPLRPTTPPALIDVLHAALGNWSAGLVDANAAHDLVAIARRVPRVMNTFGFECRLASDDPTVDLGLAVSSAHGGRSRLAALDESDAALAHDERWARISGFARRWAVPGSLLDAWIPFLFMEFDAVASADEVPVPSLFLALDAPLGASRVADEDEVDPPIEALREACALLSGRPLDADVDAQVERAYRTLPPEAWVMHVGLLLGREARGVRLSVCSPCDGVQAYLRGLGGEDAAAAAEETIGRVGHLMTTTQVDFDLTPAVRPRLGFGLKATSEDGWSKLVAEVEAQGWCDPGKGRALLDWPGVSATTVETQPFVLARAISHVKLVCAPDAPTHAKAYVGVTPVASTRVRSGPGGA